MATGDLSGFLARHRHVAEVSLAEVRGSSPREAGTVMYIAAGGCCGTIGGGQLEYLVTKEARAMLARGDLGGEMDIPLGPEIGQCCGGHVTVKLKRLRVGDRRAALQRHEAAGAALQHVLIFGSGHTGRALADLFQHLPVRCILVDPRAEELDRCGAQVEKRLCALPETEIDAAPPGSAFIVLTHDHALDFLLTSTALERDDAAYVGMIGSKTKRARFANWCRDSCDGLSPGALICPVGAGGSRDKRPSVIAAQVVAEVITTLTAETAADSVPQNNSELPLSGDQPESRKPVRKRTV